MSKKQVVDNNRESTDCDVIDFTLSLSLGAHSLRFFDPIPILMQVIDSVPALQIHCSRIYTILSELFSNALEHGLLHLHSTDKSSAQGFHDYYKKRQQALLNLKEGCIEVHLSFYEDTDGRFLKICMKDSGSGFDVASAFNQESPVYSGRGLSLLRYLCHTLSFSENGTLCEAVYCWHSNCDR